MTQTPQVGDRITLTGTVVRGLIAGTDFIRVRFDDDDGAWMLSSAALAHAKIEPRPLAVGDRVARAGWVGVLKAIDGDHAWVLWDGTLGHGTILLDRLTCIPDQST